MDNSTAAKEAFHEISTMVYRHTNDDFFLKTSKSCYKTIIEALYKQIAQKPVDVRKGKYAIVGRCPNCNDGTNSEYPYCGKCGQRIDWRV